MKNKAIFYYTCLLIIILIIQSTRFDFWSIYGVKPDLVLLFLLLVSFREGSITGTVFGFIGGLAQDFFSNSLLGSGAFAKSLWGYLAGKSNQRLDTHSIVVQTGLLFCISILDGLLINGLTGILRHPVSFKGRIAYFIVFQAIYNCLIWPFFSYGLAFIEKHSLIE
ncbi:MAG: rod shape-determining protein MreD [bacterium]